MWNELHNIIIDSRNSINKFIYINRSHKDNYTQQRDTPNTDTRKLIKLRKSSKIEQFTTNHIDYKRYKSLLDKLFKDYKISKCQNTTEFLDKNSTEQISIINSLITQCRKIAKYKDTYSRSINFYQRDDRKKMFRFQ